MERSAAAARTGRRGAQLPIAEHGLIGDLQTAALVSTNGTIDWYCPPRFDSPSVFASLLDAARGGSFGIAPVDEHVVVKQVTQQHRIVRVVRGEIPLEIHCEPRFDYARQQHATRRPRCPRGDIARTPIC